jgi:hypothetical protein
LITIGTFDVVHVLLRTRQWGSMKLLSHQGGLFTQTLAKADAEDGAFPSLGMSVGIDR